jgi:hypothetical protein
MNQPTRIKDQAAWDKWQEVNTDPYGKACVDVAREAMIELDAGLPIDKYKLITDADKKVGAGGITGFMAGCVAEMIFVCHERGEEFKRIWNKSYGADEEVDGVVNPAILTIG